MMQFEFSLTKEDVFNHLYEYIISHSCEFFGIPNRGVTYSVIIGSDNFIMLVFSDEEKNIADSLNTDVVSFTDKGYGIIRMESARQDVVNIFNGYIGLKDGEIRYVKFSWARILDETGMMFYSMVNACLKVNNHEARMTYDAENEMFSYKGTCNAKKCNYKKRAVIDITEQMRKCWY